MGEGKQALTLEDRQHLTLSGIEDVESFDDATVVLHTQDAVLVVRGEGLHLRALDAGRVFVDGRIDALVYQEPRSGGGMLSRLFGG